MYTRSYWTMLLVMEQRDISPNADTEDGEDPIATITRMQVLVVTHQLYRVIRYQWLRESVLGSQIVRV